MSAPQTPITPMLARQLVALAVRARPCTTASPGCSSSPTGAVDLRADTSRQLPLADPLGRELHLSCGAVLYTPRLALRARGLDPVVELLPDQADPTLLARVRTRAGADSSPEELRLVAAVSRRHTHRDGFTGARCRRRRSDASHTRPAARVPIRW